MYAWEENKSTTTRKKLGGKKVAETTYSYEKKWTDNPESSSSFKKPEGHDNPSPSVRSQSFRVRQATIGAYRLDPQSVDLPRASRISITAEDFIPSGDARMEGSYIFIGRGTLQNPQIGDTRISFSAVEAGISATLFGKLNRDTVEPYFHQGKKQLYRAISGPREAAIAKMASEHRLITWLLRAGGFLMMWIGLNLFFGPINVVLDFVPFLGGVSRSIIGLAMFLVALTLSLITMLVSIIAHNVFLLMGAVAAVLAAIWAMGRIRPRRKLAKAYAGAGGVSLRAGEKFERSKPSGEDEDEAMRPATQKSGSAEGKIRFACEECGKKYAVKPEFASRKVACKKCGHKLQIPSESMI
jgi:DNA-directed RNA polymerase subunit RPC12/RpoP